MFPWLDTKLRENISTLCFSLAKREGDEYFTSLLSFYSYDDALLFSHLRRNENPVSVMQTIEWECETHNDCRKHWNDQIIRRYTHRFFFSICETSMDCVTQSKHQSEMTNEKIKFNIYFIYGGDKQLELKFSEFPLPLPSPPRMKGIGI